MASEAANSSNSSSFDLNLAVFCPSPAAVPLFLTFLALYLLCHPVFLSALYVLWRKSQTPQPLSHSETFTLNTLTMEVLNLLGSCLIFKGIYKKEVSAAFSLGLCLCFAIRSGRMLFHAFTCVDRYLAVTQPITYLRLKKKAGVAVRNACIGLAWLLSAGFSSLAIFDISAFEILSLMLLVALLVLESFCTVSVLCVLIRPGPGDRRSGVSQAKRTVLYTMAIILGAQLVEMFNSTMFSILAIMNFVGLDSCLLSINTRWLELPNSLVLPLLLLHRARKGVE